MAFFEWSDELSVGVREIDGQHKNLVEMINTLNQAMIEKKGREAQKAAVDVMVDYTKSHFTTEEKYMKAFAFEGFEAHRAEHEKFTAKALDLQDRVGRGRFVLTLEIVDFLKQWLTGHIKGTDRL
ncbi:MAG TPA: bacteriohemerythrin [Spirochaetia bacterium]|nr:bacteriohemerythrin [Spirochaetia bacterium]